MAWHLCSWRQGRARQIPGLEVGTIKGISAARARSQSGAQNKDHNKNRFGVVTWGTKHKCRNMGVQAVANRSEALVFRSELIA